MGGRDDGGGGGGLWRTWGGTNEGMDKLGGGGGGGSMERLGSRASFLGGGSRLSTVIKEERCLNIFT